MTSFAKFDKDLQEAEKKFARQAKLFVDKVALDLYRNIAADARNVSGFGSPVWSGRFLASHRVSVNNINDSVAGPNPAFDNINWPDSGGKTLRPRSLSSVSNILRLSKLGDTIFISNSLDYAQFLEKGGSRTQAPNGIYRVAVEKTKIKFKNITIKKQAIG